MHIHHRWTHYFGMSLSILCLIHCLALPVITPFLPLLTGHNDWRVEAVFVLLISLSSFSLYKGYKDHEEPRSLYLGSIGFVFLIASLFFEHHTFQIVLSVLGSVFMTAAHYTNYKLCRVAPCCDH